MRFAEEKRRNGGFKDVRRSGSNCGRRYVQAAAAADAVALDRTLSARPGGAIANQVTTPLAPRAYARRYLFSMLEPRVMRVSSSLLAELSTDL